MKKPMKLIIALGLAGSLLMAMPFGKAEASSIQGTVTVKAANLYLRSANDFSSRAVKVLHRGDTYKVYGENNGMYNVDGGWVTENTKYVTFTSNTNAQAPTLTNPVSNISSGQKVVDFAKNYLGMKYVWASSNPANGGFDCSGFIYYVFKNNGYNISRANVAAYWNQVQKISTPQIGDLVFFKNTYISGPSHMGIYIGNGQMIDAQDRGIVVDNIFNPYWYSHFLGYGRFN